MENIFIDFSDLKTVELVDDFFVSFCSKLQKPNGFLPLFRKILTILFFALKTFLFENWVGYTF